MHYPFGAGLVISTLALSRIWYVASLVHMPLWVHAELAKLIVPFFWKGKPDLVARLVVTQPPTAGGFSVVDMKLKIASLLVPWIRRFVFHLAWRKIEGSSFRCSSLVVASLSPHHCCPVSEISAKHVYHFLLSENRCPPNVLRNSVLSMVIYTGPPPEASFLVLT